jgi:hypothetical protein
VAERLGPPRPTARRAVARACAVRPGRALSRGRRQAIIDGC